MNDNRLDDIFKDGLRESGMEYKEAYWTDMESRLASGSVFNWKRELILLLFIFALQSVLFFYPSGTDVAGNGDQDNSEQFAENRSTDIVPDNTNPINDEYLDESLAPSEAEVIVTEDRRVITTINPTYDPNAFLEQRYPYPNMELDSQQQEVIKQFQNPMLMTFTLHEFKWMDPKSLDQFSEAKDHKAANKVVGAFGAGSKNWAFTLEPYASIGSYMVKHDGITSDQKELEDHKSNVAAGLDFRVQRNHFSFSTGLGYSRYSGLAGYRDINPIYSYDSTLTVVNWNYDRTRTGNRVILVKWRQDTIQTGTDTSYCKDCSFKFDYMTVPLSIDYQISLGKIKLYSGLGVNWQYLLKSSGWYSGIEQVLPLPSSSLMNRSFLSAFAELGIRGPIHYPLGYFASYRYSNGLSSMTRTYNEMVDSHSVRFGLSLSL